MRRAPRRSADSRGRPARSRRRGPESWSPARTGSTSLPETPRAAASWRRDDPGAGTDRDRVPAAVGREDRQSGPPHLRHPEDVGVGQRPDGVHRRGLEDGEQAGADVVDDAVEPAEAGRIESKVPGCGLAEFRGAAFHPAGPRPPRTRARGVPPAYPGRAGGSRRWCRPVARRGRGVPPVRRGTSVRCPRNHTAPADDPPSRGTAIGEARTNTEDTTTPPRRPDGDCFTIGGSGPAHREPCAGRPAAERTEHLGHAGHADQTGREGRTGPCGTRPPAPLLGSRTAWSRRCPARDTLTRSVRVPGIGRHPCLRKERTHRP
ncbi:hypothetical protein HNR02_004954 [Amycolatopsis endophytica]|uniref:Uncharacterized protein n=1 Tax=Amycolatopsis endophytica TaxID=860233 RepID=A0A853BAC0_9PSEU|nr:hypothetical protein [Amycolatopsis endophytica]